MYGIKNAEGKWLTCQLTWTDFTPHALMFTFYAHAGRWLTQRGIAGKVDYLP